MEATKDSCHNFKKSNEGKKWEQSWVRGLLEETIQPTLLFSETLVCSGRMARSVPAAEMDFLRGGCGAGRMV